MPGYTVASIIDKLEMDHDEAMILSAIEDEDARRPD